jgi:hypothetical protein
MFNFIRSVPPTENIEENLKVISFFNTSFAETFSSSLEFLVQHLAEIPYENIALTPISALQHIFSITTVHEDKLFEIVTNLVSDDKNFLVLLPIPKFEKVHASFVRSFFENFPFEQLSSNLWESLKPRLFIENGTPFSQDQIQQIVEKVKEISKEERDIYLRIS